MSEDLVAWLRAQLDEDERVARAALVEMGDPAVFPDYRTYDVPADVDEHIARHGPGPVLREVEAKRRRLERHRPVLARDIDWAACSHCRVAYPCPDISDDLSVYADRPGYRNEWTP